MTLVRALHPGVRRTFGELRWLLLTALVLAIALFLQLRVISTVNPVDFLVYRYAVDEALNGVNLYASNVFGPMMPEGGLPYTYPPFGLLALWPSTWFGSGSSFLLWSALSLVTVIWCIWRIIPQHRRSLWILPVIATGASITSVVAHHLAFGQINIFLIALVILDLTRTQAAGRKRFLPRGALVGVAAAIKLTPGLFILFFLVTRQWRLFWASALSCALCTLGAGLIFPQMTWDFFSQALWSLGSRVSLTGDLGTSGNNSITGLLTAVGSVSETLISMVVVLSAAGLLTLAARTQARALSIQAWLIIGLSAPLISPVSWIHHWVYLLPALCFVIASERVTRARMALLSLCLLLLVVGPQGGEWLLENTAAWLWPIAWIFRQSLMLASVILIFCLASHQPAAAEESAHQPPTRTEPKPEVQSALPSAQPVQDFSPDRFTDSAAH